MIESKPVIRIATKNAGKLAEFERILGNEFEVVGLSGIDLELPEEGTESYKQNANEKARFIARSLGQLTLGDDSGIEAMALNGQPGIRSARFAGEPVSDQRNIDKLLDELDRLPGDDRSGRFVCWLALAGPNGPIATVQGTCEGTIGFEPRGSNGFGYDPVFIFPNGRTMADLSDEEKDSVSHRGNAIRTMLPILRQAVVDGNNNA